MKGSCGTAWGSEFQVCVGEAFPKQEQLAEEEWLLFRQVEKEEGRPPPQVPSCASLCSG